MEINASMDPLRKIYNNWAQKIILKIAPIIYLIRKQEQVPPNKAEIDLNVNFKKTVYKREMDLNSEYSIQKHELLDIQMKIDDLTIKKDL